MALLWLLMFRALGLFCMTPLRGTQLSGALYGLATIFTSALQTVHGEHFTVGMEQETTILYLCFRVTLSAERIQTENAHSAVHAQIVAMFLLKSSNTL